MATMASLVRERDTLKVIDDQVGAPTGAELIADVTAQAIRRNLKQPELAGLYHLAASGETSWHGYATFIAEWLQGQGAEIQATPERIAAIATRAWPTPAARPLNSRLDTAKLERVFGLTLPHWQQGVARALAERIASSL